MIKTCHGLMQFYCLVNALTASTHCSSSLIYFLPRCALPYVDFHAELDELIITMLDQSVPTCSS